MSFDGTVARRLLDKSLYPTRDEPLPMTDVADYPILSAVHAAWVALCKPDPPVRINPEDFPPRTLSHLMLVDLDEEAPDAVVRLAGTEVCTLYGGEMRGVSVFDFFHREDAEIVLDSLLDVASKGEPTLAKRSYVAVSGRPWRYTRLLLPYHPVDGRCRRIVKVVEPATLEEITAGL